MAEENSLGQTGLLHTENIDTKFQSIETYGEEPGSLRIILLLCQTFSSQPSSKLPPAFMVPAPIFNVDDGMKIPRPA